MIPKLSSVSQKLIFCSLPFVGPQSYFAKRKFKSLFEKFFPHLDVKIILKTNLTIQNFFKFKDEIPLPLVSSVIYKYNCRQCSATYIGETKKQMKVRISQHRTRSFRNNNLLPSLKPTRITDHFFETGHPIDENCFKILSKCQNYDLHILESLFIDHHKPSLNNYDSSVDLFITK